MVPPDVKARELVAGGQHDVGPRGAAPGLSVPGVADGFYERHFSLWCCGSS